MDPAALIICRSPKFLGDGRIFDCQKAALPYCFFHISGVHVLKRDDIGVGLPDILAVRAEAALTVAGLNETRNGRFCRVGVGLSRRRMPKERTC